jgi:cytochrome c biogenesis protein CcmG/thiol:disulfide interchange protein DsbE
LGSVAALVPIGACLVAVALTGCGGDEPKSAVEPREFRAALARSPRPLKQLYSRPNQIVDGGLSAYKKQLAALRGYPVVVNKWASWCGPCRLEFPIFQRLARRQGNRVAFLAVDSRDSRDAAERFLKKIPVPYPSFFDPKGEIARAFKGDRVAPETAFYDRQGRLAYTKPGPYSSARALAKDIADYAQ